MNAPAKTVAVWRTEVNEVNIGNPFSFHRARHWARAIINAWGVPIQEMPYYSVPRSFATRETLAQCTVSWLFSPQRRPELARGSSPSWSLRMTSDPYSFGAIPMSSRSNSSLVAWLSCVPPGSIVLGLLELFADPSAGRLDDDLFFMITPFRTGLEHRGFRHSSRRSAAAPFACPLSLQIRALHLARSTACDKRRIVKSAVFKQRGARCSSALGFT